MKRFLSTLIMVVLLLSVAAPAMAVKEKFCRHNYEVVDTVTPSCTREGYVRKQCTKCGSIIKDQTKRKLPHNNKEISRTDATCTKDGVINYMCSNCDGESSKTIKKLGHNYKVVEVIKQGTCQADGKEKVKCTRCGHTTTRDTKKGTHVYGEWTVTVEATENTKGVRSGKCIHCGKERTEEYYPEGTLYRKIDAKESVMVLQGRLTDCGYLNDKIDGIFGGKTEQAVKDFQTKAGVNADGIAWPETNSLLEKEWLGIDGMTVACCTRIENENGAMEYAYCEEHKAIVDAAEALAADGAADAMAQVRQMYEDELDKLYCEWLEISEDADKPSVTGAQAMFAGYLNTQEMIWNKQYGAGSQEALTKINDMLHNQLIELCGVLQIVTPAAE